jgi:hypothetical protein
MESKDYERHSETIIIPPAHVALRCDNRLPGKCGGAQIASHS